MIHTRIKFGDTEGTSSVSCRAVVNIDYESNYKYIYENGGCETIIVYENGTKAYIKESFDKFISKIKEEQKKQSMGLS